MVDSRFFACDRCLVSAGGGDLDLSTSAGAKPEILVVLRSLVALLAKVFFDLSCALRFLVALFGSKSLGFILESKGDSVDVTAG